MKNNLKCFISGFLVASTLILSVPVFSADVFKTIKVMFNTVTVKIDGKALSGDKISYNKNVYVNVKSVSDLIGKDFQTDKNGNVSFKLKSAPVNQTLTPASIQMTTPSSIQTPTPAATQTPIYKVLYSFDFESDPTENGWLVISNPNRSSVQANWMDGIYHSAYHAVRMTGDNSSGNLKKTFPIEKDKTYKLSVWNKSEDMTVKNGDSGAFIAIAQLNSNGDMISGTQRSVTWLNKHEWVNYNLNKIKAVEGAVSIGIYLGINGTGTVWFDDVRLEEVTY